MSYSTQKIQWCFPDANELLNVTQKTSKWIACPYMATTTENLCAGRAGWESAHLTPTLHTPLERKMNGACVKILISRPLLLLNLNYRLFKLKHKNSPSYEY